MNIYIIRHGETEANKKKVLQGWLDNPLNDYGRLLAVETGKEMKKQNIKFDMAFSSGLSRALETAKLVLRESGNAKTPLTIDNRIKEINCGKLEGRDLTDRTDPEVSQLLYYFYKNPNDLPPIPGGESITEVKERTQKFLKELSRKKYENVLVSTHGCALRCMLNFLYDDPSNFWQENVPVNCCVNIVEVKGEWMRLKEKDIIYYDKSLLLDNFDFMTKKDASK